MQFKLSQIIEYLGGELFGEDITVSNVASLATANSDHISFLASTKYKKELEGSKAGAIILRAKDAELVKDISKIITEDPYLYFGKLSALFHPRKKLIPYVDSTVSYGEATTFGPNCFIAKNVIMGKNVIIGEAVEISSNVVIGDNVIIGAGTIIGANVSIYDQVAIGHSCVLSSGCVIGASGFGYAIDKEKHWIKIPQVGGVIIGNYVDIGANTTIDCGALEPTIIEDGVKIDNQVQIAHNVRIGANTAIAACVGIAGSAIIGHNCQIAGASSVTGHVQIAPHTVIGGHSAVGKSLTKPDLYIGTPAIPYKSFAKNIIMINRLDKNFEEFKEFKRQLAIKSKLINKSIKIARTALWLVIIMIIMLIIRYVVIAII